LNSALIRQRVRLFHTLDHDCGYFRDRLARNLVIDPVVHNLPAVYDQALLHGFRRAGSHVYRPHCVGCQACVATRIPVAAFRPNRAQRRVLKANHDLVVRVQPASDAPHYLDLYQCYIAGRHAGGGMDNPDVDDFRRFLLGQWSDTRFIELSLEERLLAVAVTDFSARGLSAVYTFYDPAVAERSLGTLAILMQIEIARAQQIPHVYLGYWIAAHPKMDYKRRFAGVEVLRGAEWVSLTP
jgi:arginine-tRNA-protein transferase